jgi:glutathione peroxidase
MIQSRSRTVLFTIGGAVMMNYVVAMLLMMIAFQASAANLNVPFASIDGGTMTLSQWSGRPVLVVNTASRCAFTKQYRGLQALYDRYRDRGLVVLAVPWDDFRQELSGNEQVREFCDLQYGLDMPMTEITTVTGPMSHPFYRSLKAETGFEPSWNFNKVLIGPAGEVVATYSSGVKPQSGRMRRDIEALLQ